MEKAKTERSTYTLDYEKSLDERVFCRRRVDIGLPYGLTEQELASMLGIRREDYWYDSSNEARKGILPNSGKISIKANIPCESIENFLSNNGYSSPEGSNRQTGVITASELINPNLVFKLKAPGGVLYGPYLVGNTPCRLDVGEKVKVYSIMGYGHNRPRWTIPDLITILGEEDKPKADIILNPSIMIRDSFDRFALIQQIPLLKK